MPPRVRVVMRCPRTGRVGTKDAGTARLTIEGATRNFYWKISSSQSNITAQDRVGLPTWQ
jgi:hypothetical protein